MYDFEAEYRRIFETPLEEIKEDIFGQTISRMRNGTATCRFIGQSASASQTKKACPTCKKH